MKHEMLAAELVRALRGQRSQTALSRRLGFRSNVLYLWESGRRFPDLGTFLSLADRVDKRWVSRMNDFLGEPLLSSARPQVSRERALLQHWAAGSRPSELAGAMGVDRGTLARWNSGATQPRLPELLRLVELCTRRLPEFVAVFVDPKQLPSIRSTYAALLAQRRLAYEEPWSHAVLHALQVHGGQNQAEAIASSIGIEVEHVQRILTALVRARVVRLQRGVYRRVRALTVDTRANPDLNLLLKQHWASVALDRLERTRAEGRGLFSYNVFPIAREDYERLRQLHLEYFDRVRRLVAEARHADDVVVVNVQLFPLGDLGSRRS